jgi:phage shock protein PspC (stress-responsive transcriptional regulator)
MKKLYRSREDRIIAGVCGGIAEYFEIDPTLVRLVTLVLIFAFGLSIWVYPILWLIIPEKP